MSTLRRRIWWLVLVGLLAPTALLVDRPGTETPRYQAEWLQAGDTRVRALRTGSGDTTLLLIHGYGESLVAFRAIVGPLSTHYRVVALDLPGSGLSENPPRDWGLQATVSRAGDFLDRHTEGPVVAIGHSMGGEVSAALGLARPDRVVGLVLIAPAGYALGLGLEGDDFSETERRLAAWSLRARSLLVPIRAPHWMDEPPDLPAEQGSDSLTEIAARTILQEFDFTALRDRFRDITQPTLILWGRLDPLIPVDVGRRIAEEIPGARLVEFGNAWHRPHVEQPERVTQEILRFLACPGEAGGGEAPC